MASRISLSLQEVGDDLAGDADRCVAQAIRCKSLKSRDSEARKRALSLPVMMSDSAIAQGENAIATIF